MKKHTLFITASLLSINLACAAVHASDQMPPRKLAWTFDGIFGRVDEQAAQRGFQVYKEVCAACHGLNRIAFRNLSEIGFSNAEIMSLAATYEINDGPDDEGNMFKRPGKASDYFPPPYANENAARSVHNGALPPDLSLIVKARPDGANYLFSLMTGYKEAPAGVEISDGQHYNPYFPGGKLMMPPPLNEGQVTYSDGTASSVDQMSKDVTVFLQWAAEPEMQARKQTGIKVLVYLAIFTVFMYLAKRNIWNRIH